MKRHCRILIAILMVAPLTSFAAVTRPVPVRMNAAQVDDFSNAVPTTPVSIVPSSGNLQPSPEGVRSISPREMVSLIGLRMAAYVNNVSEAVRANTTIVTSDRDQYVKDLNGMNSWLQQQSAAATRAELDETLKSKIESIRSFWEQKRTNLQYYLGELKAAQIRAALDRFTIALTKLDLLTARDTRLAATLKPQRDEMENALNEAHKHYEAAKVILGTMKSKSGSADSYDSLVKELREAHSFLQKARTVLATILESAAATIPSTTTSTSESL